jgi:hypothetical protein
MVHKIGHSNVEEESSTEKVKDSFVSKRETHGEIIRYPISIGMKKAPAILFNIHKAVYDVEGKVVTSGDGHIALYMTQGVSFKDAMIYEERQSGIGGSLMDANFDLKTVIKSADKGLAGAIAGSGGGKAVLTGIGASLGGIPGAVGGLLLSGIADESIKETQEVLRENPFVTFKGIGLREWSFTWSFIPESEEESIAAKNIINRFRLAMYPEKDDFTLHFPKVFNIEFINANFPKMPEVVLHGCDISYNKDSSSFFMENNEPVRIDMTLNFKELSAIYYSHIKQGY